MVARNLADCEKNQTSFNSFANEVTLNYKHQIISLINIISIQTISQLFFIRYKVLHIKGFHICLMIIFYN